MKNPLNTRRPSMYQRALGLFTAFTGIRTVESNDTPSIMSNDESGTIPAKDAHIPEQYRGNHFNRRFKKK